MKFSDVMDNVQAYMTGSGADRPRTVPAVVTTLGAELGQDNSSGSTFDGQVRRALDKLVGAGVLERRKPPILGYHRRDWLYAPAGWWDRQAAERAAKATEKEAAEAAYRERVKRVLDAAGIGFRFYGQDVLVSREQTDGLLAALEGGRA